MAMPQYHFVSLLLEAVGVRFLAPGSSVDAGVLADAVANGEVAGRDSPLVNAIHRHTARAMVCRSYALMRGSRHEGDMVATDFLDVHMMHDLADHLVGLPGWTPQHCCHLRALVDHEKLALPGRALEI